MGKSRQKGRYSVYVGVRVEKQLKDAVVAKARKDGIDLGDAYRTAFRMYVGRAIAVGAPPMKIKEKKADAKLRKTIKKLVALKPITKTELKSLKTGALRKKAA